MTDDANILAFFESLADTIPEISDFVGRIQRGEMTEAEATLALTHLVNTTNRQGDVAEAAQKHLGLDQALFGDSTESQSVMDGEHALHLAWVTERLQFDGDAPELRTGAMPPGATPAVPVLTDATCPVTLGIMLRKASQEMATRQEEYRERMKELAATEDFFLEEGDLLDSGPLHEGMSPTSLQAQAALGQGPMVLKEGNPYLQARELTFLLKEQGIDQKVLPEALPTFDPPEYRRQTLPPARKVSEPTGAELLALTPEERKEYAWGFISTTQGRRSVLPTLAHRICHNLKRRGYDVIPVAPSCGMAPIDACVSASWRASLMGGRDSIHEGFSYVDVASAALSQRLLEALVDRGVSLTQTLHLIVTTADDIPERVVGWGAWLFEESPDASDVPSDRGSALLPST